MAKRILFLAAELQPFLASGIKSLLENEDVETLVYCRRKTIWVNFAPSPAFKLFTYDYEPETFFWKQIDEFKPDIVFCAGWMFPIYMSWCRVLKKAGVRTICAMDTQWKATLKQKMFVLAAPFVLHSTFDYAWVPGRRQEDYAKRLGFSDDKILHQLYAPDTDLFAEAFAEFSKNIKSDFSHTFFYAGRLEPHKIKNLLLAFRSLTEAERKDWTMRICGDGSMEKSPLLQHSEISFTQSIPQAGLIRSAADGGVFCLCSATEPWGTVAQEFAAAGMPLLLSQQCGSSEHFLESNGFLCDGTDVESIRNGLLKMIHSTDQELFEMSRNSHLLGVSSNSGTWARELMALA